MNGARSGRNVLVSGGSRGIGRQAVRRFARAGDTVWFTYRTGVEPARALVAELSGVEGRRVRAFPLDQGDWDSHERLFAALPGPVDVLVNNAAAGSATVERYEPGPAHRQAEALLRINSLGPLWLTQRVLPTMLKRGYGKVVNVSSVGGGIAAFPGFQPADGMSKAALVHLTRQLAVELAHAPVEVFAVCPGAVETGMLAASTLDQMDAAARTAFEDRLPKGRLIRPEEVAELIHWLCGPHATVLHGAVMDASMGLGLAPSLFAPHREPAPAAPELRPAVP
jgi:NAD(P)-dependent dehydrogenase (short-subunit alcohol dehydrogenase family)